MAMEVARGAVSRGQRGFAELAADDEEQQHRPVANRRARLSTRTSLGLMAAPTNYGFIKYTQVRMTKLLVLLLVCPKA